MRRSSLLLLLEVYWEVIGDHVQSRKTVRFTPWPTLVCQTGTRLNVFIGDMYNRYICPLQPCRHFTLKLLIQGHTESAEVTHIADFKSAYISLIIGPRGLQCETNL